jgi:hypothetical protein
MSSRDTAGRRNALGASVLSVLSLVAVTPQCLAERIALRSWVEEGARAMGLPSGLTALLPWTPSCVAGLPSGMGGETSFDLLGKQKNSLPLCRLPMCACPLLA